MQNKRNITRKAICKYEEFMKITETNDSPLLSLEQMVVFNLLLDYSTFLYYQKNSFTVINKGFVTFVVFNQGEIKFS